MKHDHLEPAERVTLAGVPFNRLSEKQVITYVVESVKNGRGGWIATPNIDICRAAGGEPGLRELLASASLVTPDGMPLLWAAKMRNDPLPERVTGSGLIFTLTEAAARHGLSIYLLGGEPGVPSQAGEALRRRYPGLVVAGTDSPHVDRAPAPDTVEAVRARLAAAGPDIVYVGLGFPKQERLITAVSSVLPNAWFVSCGAAIAFAAGSVPRAPQWMQGAGLEWVHRLLREPRRLFSRYVLQDMPFAAALLASSALHRALRLARRRPRSR